MSGPTVADRRVHPATVPLRFAKEAPSTLLALPAAFAWMGDHGLTGALWAAGGLALATLLFQYVRWRSFKYGIGPRELVIESGLLHRNRRSIPIERIQDVDIERGPLQRLFGLAKVRIETGGSGSDEGMLDSLKLDEAERLRVTLRRARSGVAIAADDAQEEAEPEGEILYAMPLGRVLLSGLFRFSLVWLAAIYGMLETFKNVLPFDIYDPARWIGILRQGQDQHWFAPAYIAAALLLALLLGIAAGMLRTISRDYGFKLTLEDGQRFRRERGLFTHTEVVIPRKRIQAAAIETGPVRQWLDAHRLTLQTIGMAKDGNAGGGQDVAPFARGGEVDAILAAEGRLRRPDPAILTPVSSRHIVRVLLREVGAPLGVIVVAAMLFPPLWFALALIPLLGARALLQRRFHRYALEGGSLFITRGVWKRKLWIVPVRSIQAVRVSRTWLQRLLGVRTIAVDTAGASALSPARIIDIGDEAGAALAGRLLTDMRSI